MWKAVLLSACALAASATSASTTSASKEAKVADDNIMVRSLSKVTNLMLGFVADGRIIFYPGRILLANSAMGMFILINKLL